MSSVGSILAEGVIIFGFELAKSLTVSFCESIRKNNYKKIQSYRDRLSKINYQKKSELLDHVGEIIKNVKYDLSEMNKIIQIAKEDKREFLAQINSRKESFKKNDYEFLKLKIREIDQKIDLYYAEKYRFNLYLDDLNKIKKTIKKVPAKHIETSKIPLPKFTDYDFSDNFPIKNHVINGKIIKLSDEYKIELDYGIRAMFPKGEKYSGLEFNDRSNPLFVERINYWEKCAIVSLHKAILIKKIFSNQNQIFKGEVLEANEHGFIVFVENVLAFLPRRYSKNENINCHDIIKIKFIENQISFGQFILMLL